MEQRRTVHLHALRHRPKAGRCPSLPCDCRFCTIQAMSDAFPTLGKQDLRVKTDLEAQIYTLDALSPGDAAALLRWAQKMTLEGPKKPGKGEAERTSCESLLSWPVSELNFKIMTDRAALHSTDIAASICDILKPYLRTVDTSLSSPLCSPNIRVYHYTAGTFFRPHYDTPQLDQSSRKLSCWTVLIYLSACKGGATRFHLDTEQEKDRKKSRSKSKPTREADRGLSSLAVEPRPGRILLHWHGNARGGCLRHEGEEVLSGDKWILRTDILV